MLIHPAYLMPQEPKHKRFRIILTYVPSHTVCDLSWHTGQINTFDRVPVFNFLIHGKPRIVDCKTSNVTGRHRGAKQKLSVGYTAPSIKRTLHVAMCFHCRVWYLTLSLLYTCIQNSGIILSPTFVPNFVSFVASIAEIAHAEKSHIHSLTQLI